MSKEDNLKVARRFRETLWTGDDPGAADEIFAPGCEIHGQAPFATGFASGPEAIRQLVAFYQLTFTDIRMTVERTVTEGDFVALHWSARGLHTGDLLGAPPTGREVKTTGIDLLRISGGRIVEGWMTWDVIGLLAQLFDSNGDENGPDLLSVVKRLLG
jgi:predicted ester cyclase